MSDNITLPREVVEKALRVAEVASKHAGLWTADPLIEALRAALAAPRPEPGLMELAQQMKPLDADMAAILHANLDSLYITDEPAAAPEPEKERAEVAPPARGVGQLEEIDSFTPEVYPEKRHPCAGTGGQDMNEKPEALRLAENLVNQWWGMTASPSGLPEISLVAVAALRVDAARLLREQHAEIERLTADIEALRRDAERYWRLLNWLVKPGLLTLERCRIDSPASYGDWWILRKPKVIDGSSLLGYGKTEDAAIDAAMDPATEPAIRAQEQEDKT